MCAKADRDGSEVHGGLSSGIQIAYIKVYKGEAPYAFDETVVDDANVDDLLYFVDAGDYNTSTVPEARSWAF
mgnify:CR=1 FL=1